MSETGATRQQYSVEVFEWDDVVAEYKVLIDDEEFSDGFHIAAIGPDDGSGRSRYLYVRFRGPVEYAAKQHLLEWTIGPVRFESRYDSSDSLRIEMSDEDETSYVYFGYVRIASIPKAVMKFLVNEDRDIQCQINYNKAQVQPESTYPE